MTYLHAGILEGLHEHLGLHQVRSSLTMLLPRTIYTSAILKAVAHEQVLNRRVVLFIGPIDWGAYAGPTPLITTPTHCLRDNVAPRH